MIGWHFAAKKIPVGKMACRHTLRYRDSYGFYLLVSSFIPFFSSLNLCVVLTTRH